VTKHLNHDAASSVSAVDEEKANWFIFQSKHSTMKLENVHAFSWATLLPNTRHYRYLPKWKMTLRWPPEKHVCLEQMYFSKS